VDETNREPPLPELLNEVFQGVFELRENQQPLIRFLEESLLPKNRSKLAELRFRLRLFELFRPIRKLFETGDLLANLIWILSDRDCGENTFQPLTLHLFHFFEVFFSRDIARRGQGYFLGSLEIFRETARAVLQ